MSEKELSEKIAHSISKIFKKTETYEEVRNILLGFCFVSISLSISWTTFLYISMNQQFKALQNKIDRLEKILEKKIKTY
jgi:hypothetical protein